MEGDDPIMKWLEEALRDPIPQLEPVTEEVYHISDEVLAESKLVTGKPLEPWELALVVLAKIRRIPGETLLVQQIEHLQEVLVERLKNADTYRKS